MNIRDGDYVLVALGKRGPQWHQVTHCYEGNLWFTCGDNMYGTGGSTDENVCLTSDVIRSVRHVGHSLSEVLMYNQPDSGVGVYGGNMFVANDMWLHLPRNSHSERGIGDMCSYLHRSWFSLSRAGSTKPRCPPLHWKVTLHPEKHTCDAMGEVTFMLSYQIGRAHV